MTKHFKVFFFDYFQILNTDIVQGHCLGYIYRLSDISLVTLVECWPAPLNALKDFKWCVWTFKSLLDCLCKNFKILSTPLLSPPLILHIKTKTGKFIFSFHHKKKKENFRLRVTVKFNIVFSKYIINYHKGSQG